MKDPLPSSVSLLNNKVGHQNLFWTVASVFMGKDEMPNPAFKNERIISVLSDYLANRY